MNYLFVDLGKHYGGAEIYIQYLITECHNRGWHCMILVRRNSPMSAKVKTKMQRDSIIEADFTIGDLRKVRQIIQNKNIDLIHINGINSAVFVRALSVAKPTVTTVHSDAYVDRSHKKKFIRDLFVFAERYCLKKSDGIITVSNAMKEKIIEHKVERKKITVIENGVPKIDYEEKPKTNSRQLRICYVGRLEKVKGVDILIKALAKVKTSNWKCDLFGEGTENGKLEKKAEQLSIDKKINFVGFQSDVRFKIQNYDVMILPSRYEACSLTLLEAMNARTLVVCSDVGGMKEIIEDGINGYKFPIGDEDKLAEIIGYLCNCPDEVQELTKNAYQKFVDKYNIEYMLVRTFDYFQRVVDKNV